MACSVNVESMDRIIYSIFHRFNLEWKTRTLSVFTQLDVTQSIGELEPPRLTVYKDIGRTMLAAMLKLRFPARAMQTSVSLKRSAKSCF